MADRPYNVLFLCTGNSARSIIAESILNREGCGKFRAFSAGSQPTGKVNPYALQLLEQMRIPAGDARSKSWEEFAYEGAPVLDFVFTVCGNAAGEVCPVWPGKPVTAHWGVEDPASVDGDEMAKVNAFRHAYDVLEHRIKVFANLPVAGLDTQRLSARLREIGTSQPGE